MSRHSLLASFALCLGLVAPALVATTPAQAAPPAPPCVPLLAANAQARTAIAQLGAGLSIAAARNEKSPTELRSMAEDPTFWLDRCGKGYYVEEAPDLAQLGAVETAAAPVVDLSQTFLLNSKKGSLRTIYLDFTGYRVSNSAWYAGTWDAIPYDTDKNLASFSDAEKTAIQDVWRRVAEDYAAFDVNVTTEPPAAGVLERDSLSDLQYGTSAVITGDATMWQATCSSGCGGVAYIGVFDSTGTSHEYYQPAWVFSNALGSSKSIAEAASHEVGHNLGLRHDGTSSTGYYRGGAGWAPIMGVGYYEAVTQWSQGEYTGANNKEDDFVLMASNGVAARADDHGNSSGTATAIGLGTTSGIISTRTDSDWFRLTAPAAGTYTFAAAPAWSGPNLDIKLDVYDSTGSNRLGTSDPPLVKVTSDRVTGLDASVALPLAAGTYFVRIDGVGYASTSNFGSDYGSLGQYSLDVTSDSVVTLGVTTPSLPTAELGVPYSVTLAAIGGTPSYTWSLASGTLPAWATLSPEGVLSGTPTATSTSSLTVQVTDAAVPSGSATKDLTLTVVGNPVVVTATLGDATANAAYTATLQASGGVGSYTWSASGLPGWLTLNSTTGVLSGTPTTATASPLSFQVSVRDALGVSSAAATLTLVVKPAPLAIATLSLPSVKAGRAYSTQLSATGGVGGYVWTAISLPGWLSLNTSTGVLSSTRVGTRGTYSVTVSVTSGGETIQKTFSLRVT